MTASHPLSDTRDLQCRIPPAPLVPARRAGRALWRCRFLLPLCASLFPARATL